MPSSRSNSSTRHARGESGNGLGAAVRDNAFAASKLSLTGLGILTLVYLGKARFLDRVRAGLFLTVFFSGYACLVCYEIVQLLQLL